MPERRSATGDGDRRRRRHRSWARRRHLGLKTTAAAVVVLVVGVVLVVLTWDSGRPSFRDQVAAAGASASSAAANSSAPPATIAPEPTVTGATPGGDPGPSIVAGTISAVGDDRWTLAGSNGLTYTIVVTGDTRLTRGRTFSSFGVGDTVSVQGRLQLGTITAEVVALTAVATGTR